MSMFLLKAKSDLQISHDLKIKKGDQFDVFIGKPGVNKSNIFCNPESRASIIRQLSNKDIDLAANRKEYFLSGGYFQVEERKNVLASHM